MPDLTPAEGLVLSLSPVVGLGEGWSAALVFENVTQRGGPAVAFLHGMKRTAAGVFALRTWTVHYTVLDVPFSATGLARLDEALRVAIDAHVTAKPADALIFSRSRIR